MTDESNDSPPIHPRFQKRRESVANARAQSSVSYDRTVEELLHTDGGRSKKWQRTITSLGAHNTIENVYVKQFNPPLLKKETDALIRALADYGVIDTVNTAQGVGTYTLTADEHGLVWQLRIHESRYDKMALARDVYTALREPSWEKNEYPATPSMKVYTYAKTFSEPLMDGKGVTTEGGKAIETALARLGLKRTQDYDWAEKDPTRLHLPEAAYARAIITAFAPKPESPAR